jgi:dTDP-glucose pyrophosphorylase
MMPVAILAGGLATRLRPLTERIPKALLEVAGKPFAVHQLELLRRHGLTQVVFCVGYLGEQVQAALGDGRRWGMNLQYVFDGPALLGTGGALRRALPLLDEAFLVLYGDAYLECDYGAVERTFRASSKLGLMTVFYNANRWDRSNVLFAEGQILCYDKRHPTPDMQHIDYGLGAFRAQVFDSYPEGQPLDLATIYQDLVAQGQLAGFQVTQRFYEIGSPAGLEETQRYLSQKRSGILSYTQQFLAEAAQILAQLDVNAIDQMVAELVNLRSRGGRLFLLGSGGGAGHASHAACDFRKIAGIEAYALTDNVSELTARINDDGWESSYVNWLKLSRLSSHDMVFIFSVGGGNLEHNISPNLVHSLEYARQVGATICGIVGRDGGYTARVADACVIVPTVNPDTVTPHVEAFQALVWHLLVSHTNLQAAAMKWESVT